MPGAQGSLVAAKNSGLKEQWLFFHRKDKGVQSFKRSLVQSPWGF